MDYFTNLQKNCYSFTLGFENNSYDESKYVKKIEKELKYKPDNTDNNLQKFINHIKNSNC